MKPLWYLIISVTALLGSLWCVFLLAYNSFPLQPQASTDIVVEDSERNIGILCQNEKRPIVYTLKNNTKYPIVLGSVKTSCSCTGLTLSDWNLPFDESIDMTLLFDSGQMRGRVGGYVVYTYAVPELKKNGIGRLSFEAVVKPNYEVEPDTLEFDCIADSAQQKEIFIISMDKAKLIRIEKAEPTRDWFDCVVIKNNDQSEDSVTVRFIESKWNRIEKEAVLMITTSCELQKVFSVMLKVN